MGIVETAGLTKRFGKTVAVEDLSLDIAEGEFFGLLGPNGAGKSTALLMLATLIPPTSGDARVNGFDLSRQARQVRGSIGIVFQDPSSDDTLTGYENLKLHGMMYGLPAALREQRIREVLDLVELGDRRDDLVKEYSGGMRRRLELARGLMHRPRVLYLDEPTLGLDPQSRDHIWGYVERLAHDEHMTVILTTHYMEEADRLCTRLAIIDEAKVVALDTPDALKGALGGDIVSLETEQPNVEALRALGYADKIEQRDGRVRFTVRDASHRLQEILHVVGPVRSVEVRPASLDDVFVHHTGRQMHDATAEGGWGKRTIRYQSAAR